MKIIRDVLSRLGILKEKTSPGTSSSTSTSYRSGETGVPTISPSTAANSKPPTPRPGRAKSYKGSYGVNGEQFLALLLMLGFTKVDSKDNVVHARVGETEQDAQYIRVVVKKDDRVQLVGLGANASDLEAIETVCLGRAIDLLIEFGATELESLRKKPLTKEPK